MNTLETRIKVLIVQTLHLEGVDPISIDADMPLFGGDLGLDSIDALEIGIALKKEFGLEFSVGDPAIKEHFRCVRNLAALVGERLEAPCA